MARVAITKGHKMGHLTEVCHLTVLEARSPRSRYQQGWFLLRTVRDTLLQAGPWLLVVGWPALAFLGL